MGGCVNQSVIYLGLFLMAVALYGFEVTQSKANLSAHKDKIVVTQELPPELSPKLEVLYKRFTADPFFNSQAPGVKVQKNLKTVTITFYGGDVYESGGFAMNESWFSVLDRIEDIIHPELDHGLRVQIKGYADSNDPTERKASDYGDSDLTFSFARAEWVARYFERKWGVSIRNKFEMTGVGAQLNGKRTELVFNYSSSSGS